MAKDLGIRNNEVKEFGIYENSFIHFLKSLSVTETIEQFFVTARKSIYIFSSPVIGR